jgi:hypothetical protein
MSFLLKKLISDLRNKSLNILIIYSFKNIMILTKGLWENFYYLGGFSMFSAIYNALKALVSKIPWSKVSQFLSWAYEFAKVAASKAYSQALQILDFIKNNPGKIVDWFLKGYSVYEIIKMILG